MERNRGGRDVATTSREDEGGKTRVSTSGYPAKKTVVTCACCEIEVHFDYKGRCPPHDKSIVFLEEGYFRLDPFTDRRRPLFIGADCSVCSRPVCAQPTCSLFYTRRFCAACAKQNEEAFPLELQRDIDKLQAMVAAPVNYDLPPLPNG